MGSINILLVEDNEGDIHLMNEAFEESKANMKLNIVRNGEAALDYISKLGQYSEVSTPELIILDINIPLKNGYEILQYIKLNKATQDIPVIMLSTSSAQEDKDFAYESFANHFITKPSDAGGYLELVSQIEEFWTGYCR